MDNYHSGSSKLFFGFFYYTACAFRVQFYWGVQQALFFSSSGFTLKQSFCYIKHVCHAPIMSYPDAQGWLS